MRRVASDVLGDLGWTGISPSSLRKVGGSFPLALAACAFSYKGCTSFRCSLIKAMRDLLAGWLDIHCGGAPRAAALIFSQSVIPAAGS